MNISVVIPAFNEAGVLPGTLRRLDAFLEGSGVERKEIIVVDDGSTDGTAEAVESLDMPEVSVLRLPANRGKGAAVRAGVLENDGPSTAFNKDTQPVRPDLQRNGQTGDEQDSSSLSCTSLSNPNVVIVTDADGNYLHNRAAPFLEAIRAGADIVMASRAHPGSVWKVSPAASSYIRRRRVMGRFFNGLVRRVCGLPVGDTQTGLKFFRAAVARALFRDQRLTGFAYDVEVLFRARRRGYRIRELPLVYSCPSPESKVTRLDPARMVLDLFRVRRLCRGELQQGRTG